MAVIVKPYITEFKMVTKTNAENLFGCIFAYGEKIPVVKLFAMVAISISEMVEFLNIHSKNGHIEIDKDNFISLTKEGYLYYASTILKTRHKGEEYLAAAKEDVYKVGINQPYIPDKDAYLKIKEWRHRRFRD